jgi:hypothetical protein
MTHKDDDSDFGGLGDFLSDISEAAKDAAGGILDGVTSLVDHVTPDGVGPFGGGAPGGVDAPALLDSGPIHAVEVFPTVVDFLTTVAVGGI